MHTSRIKRQALVDPLGAEVRQIELNVVEPVGSREAPAFQDFRHFRAGDDVARRKLHHLGRVLLHEALALVVAQVAALAAAALGHEDARGHQTRRVELEELRILQSQARAVGDGLSVARDGLRVSGETIEVPQSPGGDQKSLAAQNEELARGSIVERKAGETSAVEEQGRGEALVVALEVSYFSRVS